MLYKPRRTFLLGAGFSKAVADGPLMGEIWERMKQAHEREKSRKYGRSRVKWFETIKSNIDQIENAARKYFGNSELSSIFSDLKDNIEKLYTILDLHLLSDSLINSEKENVKILWDKLPSRFTSILLIPIGLSVDELKEMRSRLNAYLYLILVNLMPNELSAAFSEIIDGNDEFITFNYDLILEKGLINKNMWSPLDGYVGISDFEREDDKEMFKDAGRRSKIKIHKVHGSINWQNNLFQGPVISLDNKERGEWHFEICSKLLKREPHLFKPEGSDGYGGGYNTFWVSPSFIKSYEENFDEILQSAKSVLSRTDELVIIGFSFRNEDEAAWELLSQFSRGGKMVVIDLKPEDISKRLQEKGFGVLKSYNGLSDYIKEQKMSF
ncbi:MAG: SIR2 family protein [Chloroflexi bacterium]|nr:SIR2 family protein [Chloroflexota bacterium]